MRSFQIMRLYFKKEFDTQSLDLMKRTIFATNNNPSCMSEKKEMSEEMGINVLFSVTESSERPGRYSFIKCDENILIS